MSNKTLPWSSCEGKSITGNWRYGTKSKRTPNEKGPTATEGICHVILRTPKNLSGLWAQSSVAVGKEWSCAEKWRKELSYWNFCVWDFSYFPGIIILGRWTQIPSCQFILVCTKQGRWMTWCHAPMFQRMWWVPTVSSSMWSSVERYRQFQQF